MRPRTPAAIAATSALGAAAVALAAGRFAARAALLPVHPRRGEARLPAGFYGSALTVHQTTEETVALTRSLTAGLPGTYGLRGRGVRAVVGPVMDEESQRHGADTVVRRLETVLHGELTTGARVRLTPQVYTGDPYTALGIEYSDVAVPAELGALPAWFTPGEREVWVIAVHGLGTTREHPMVMLPFFTEHGLPVLNLGYRGDPSAPRPPDGSGHLGETEWRDLDAAIRYAVRQGAERVVLHGWSSGASMALHAAANSELRGRISGLVLDSPILDLRTTLRALVAARHTPRPLLPLATRAAEARTGTHAERLAAVADPEALEIPTLLLHGPDDTVAPWDATLAFAEARPDLVTMRTVAHAPHAAMWNADPEGYEEAVRRFLTPLM